jgi:hypothetical protein
LRAPSPRSPCSIRLRAATPSERRHSLAFTEEDLAVVRKRDLVQGGGHKRLDDPFGGPAKQRDVRRLLDRKITRFGALQYFINVNSRTSVLLRIAGAIRNKTTCLCGPSICTE